MAIQDYACFLCLSMVMEFATTVAGRCFQLRVFFLFMDIHDSVCFLCFISLESAANLSLVEPLRRLNQAFSSTLCLPRIWLSAGVRRLLTDRFTYHAVGIRGPLNGAKTAHELLSCIRIVQYGHASSPSQPSNRYLKFLLCISVVRLTGAKPLRQ